MGVRLLSFWLLAASVARAAIPDQPFLQDVSVRINPSADLTNAAYRKLCVDKDNVVYVLTDKGVARVFGDTLALDRSFRPLAGNVPRDITLSPNGDLYYLFEDRWLSNDENGKPLGHVPPGRFDRIAVSADGSVLLSGSGGWVLAQGNTNRDLGPSGLSGSGVVFPARDGFWSLSQSNIIHLDRDGHKAVLGKEDATTLAARGDEVLIGTHDGYYGLDARSGEITSPRQMKLPAIDVTRIFPTADGLWFGTTRGLFFLHAHSAAGADGAARSTEVEPELPEGPKGTRYYASRRWLRDDQVVDLAVDRDRSVWALTKTGLNKIELRRMTLAEKADLFDRKVRARHIRFGLTAERRLPVAGDISSSELIDTDNDGGWSSYYLASQAFRFAVTSSSKARANAWDVFAALERLQSINPLPGFSARTFERAGFKFSDPDRWREVPGGDWEWKGTTSSDEIASQTFAHAAMWECVAKTEAERQRVAANFTRLVDHIIDHNWYLIDVDGKPTLWGRWNPEYVNWYPPSIFDRRLNSSEIIASLQLAYTMSGNERYQKRARELFDKFGYLTNIVSSMKLLKATPGFMHLGVQMGDEWNHSDDELAFVTYWVLDRFAFTDELRAKYAKAIKEHWEFEEPERYPMWNFIYAGCGGQAHCDAEGAVWTLRGFPVDTITWHIDNAPRKDLTRLAPSFMGREMKELLPPGERPIVRCNTQPFLFEGGDGGHTELPGDEFLLGYWLGRYLTLIE